MDNKLKLRYLRPTLEQFKGYTSYKEYVKEGRLKYTTSLETWLIYVSNPKHRLTENDICAFLTKMTLEYKLGGIISLEENIYAVKGKKTYYFMLEKIKKKTNIVVFFENHWAHYWYNNVINTINLYGETYYYENQSYYFSHSHNSEQFDCITYDTRKGPEIRILSRLNVPIGYFIGEMIDVESFIKAQKDFCKEDFEYDYYKSRINELFKLQKALLSSWKDNKDLSVTVYNMFEYITIKDQQISRMRMYQEGKDKDGYVIMKENKVHWEESSTHWEEYIPNKTDIFTAENSTEIKGSDSDKYFSRIIESFRNFRIKYEEFSKKLMEG